VHAEIAKHLLLRKIINNKPQIFEIMLQACEIVLYLFGLVFVAFICLF